MFFSSDLSNSENVAESISRYISRGKQMQQLFTILQQNPKVQNGQAMAKVFIGDIFFLLLHFCNALARKA